MASFPSQYLKHGKALCGKVFGQFVDTFNALVDMAVNVKGDADGNNGEGHVSFDRSDPLHPVIRCRGCEGSGSDVTANEKSGLSVKDGEIDLAGRNEGDSFGIRTLTVKGAKGEVRAEHKVIGTEDVDVTQLDEEDIEELKKDVKSECVESVNSANGKLSVIGGKGVRVSTNGKVIKITADAGKEEDDPEPEQEAEEGNPCDHPGNNDGEVAKGGGGIEVEKEKVRDSGGGGGCGDCGGQSTTGGSASGSPEPGASGKPAEGATGGGPSAPGKKVTTPPSSGSSGTASGSPGKEIRPGSMEATVANAKTPIYTGTHKALTDTKKMNQSPFKSDPNWHGSMEDTVADTKKPIYSGTHAALTDTKKMNESPFKKASK